MKVSLRVRWPLAVRVKDLNAAFWPIRAKIWVTARRCMIAALRSDVMEGSPIGQIDLKHLVQPGRSRAIFQKRQFGAGLHLDAMVKHHIRSL
jgi:hypothetical protein